MTSQYPEPDRPAWNQPEGGPAQWGQGPAQPPPPPQPAWAGGTGPAQGQWRPPPGAGSAQRTNTLAIVALILSVVVAPVGLILGFIARQPVRQRGEGGNGLALAAIIIGAVLTLTSVCGIIASLGNSGTGY